MLFKVVSFYLYKETMCKEVIKKNLVTVEAIILNIIIHIFRKT